MTLALVAMTAAVYGYPRWGAIYLAAGVWALVFLALTPLIIKALMFDRRPARGLALIAAKFFWLGLVFWAFVHWNRAGAGARLPGSALIAGVTTPLVVVVLRVLGGALEPKSAAPAGSDTGSTSPGD